MTVFIIYFKKKLEKTLSFIIHLKYSKKFSFAKWGEIRYCQSYIVCRLYGIARQIL
jgi:hypothetical protein